MRKSIRFRRLAVLTAGALVALGTAAAFTGTASAAPSPAHCSDESIPAGVYSSLTVDAGSYCSVDEGTVIVTGNVVLKFDSGLYADFASGLLQVKGNIVVGEEALLVLGCAPNTDSPCYDKAKGSSNPSVGGTIIGKNDWGLEIVNTNVKGLVKETNANEFAGVTASDVGGGCPQFYGTWYENSQFGSTITETGANTCYTALLRNKIVGTVTWNNNYSDSVDGNAIAGNQIGGDLKCKGNDPAPHGDSPSSGPNLVAGTRTGQCQDVLVP